MIPLHLIDKAIDKHGTIYPCANMVYLTDCFTNYDGKWIFWYNTEDNSTHVVTEEVC